MRRPRPSHLLCVFLAAAAAASGQVSELETRPLATVRAEVVALILGGSAGGAPPGGAPPGGAPPGGDLGAGPLDATPSGPAASGDGLYGVDFRVEVAGPSLLKGAPGERGKDLRLEAHAYVLTRSGDLEATLGRGIRIPQKELDLLPSGGIRLAGHLEIPAGEYQLRVLVRDTRTQRFALRLVGFQVPATDAEPVRGSPVRGSPGLRAVVIADLDLSPESIRDQDFLGERSGKRIGAIAAGYRDVLGRLAQGRTADAVAGLRQLETEALELDPKRSRASEWLTAGLDRVVDEIAEGSPDSLLPILFLHAELHTLYLDDRIFDPYRIDLTRQRIVDLAASYALSENEMAATLASAVVADTGVTLDQAARFESARRMFEAALQLDDKNPIALLNLACWYERGGEYGKAVRLLRRLLDVVPRSPEASLRLALSLGRLDQQQDEQEEILRRLIRASPAEWLLAIAYQELGELLTAGGRLEEARQLLANGISRLPSQQRLYIQLAYVLDRSGRKRDALEVVDRIPADHGRLSPRHLYGHRRRDGEPVRATLLRQVTARLPVLAEELQRSEKEK